MVSCALVLVPLWILGLSGGCRAEELPREVVLSWFSGRVLEGLGLEEPPLASAQGPDVDPAQQGGARPLHVRPPRSRRTWEDQWTSPTQDKSQIILFPSSDSSCGSETSSSHFTYYFQPSLSEQEVVVTAAHFWFYAGEGGNMSAPLFILTSAPQLLQAAEAPSQRSPDGWTTYDLERPALASVAQGPFILQVRCAACECHADQPDKTPFLDLTAQPRARVKSRRHAPLSIPWSPSAVDLLQRPSVERPEHSDCQRAHVEISFKELGWDNWIVHPTALTFYYCHGNCSAGDRTTASLGIRQCCAPVPGSMRSLRITTTSDGGYSFKYETLPNIIPEECTCI
ncbi:inhibin alpha chain [Pleuronectes platessa]|uniref:inhibin alpha chain n=1 Tax=Pleuronectes platessa TaxID=8262 RepID=UPI00232A6E1E|nr:inhibin alpha chain [Pleuronectes platessa]